MHMIGTFSTRKTVKLAFKKRVFTFTRFLSVLGYEFKSCVMKLRQVSKLFAKFGPNRARKNNFITILVFFVISVKVTLVFKHAHRLHIYSGIEL